jgi:hypothetical protein
VELHMLSKMSQGILQENSFAISPVTALFLSCNCLLQLFKDYSIVSFHQVELFSVLGQSTGLQ